MLETLLAKFAAAGLVAKAAAGGAAVVVATTAAGAASALPEPAQEAFDQVVVTSEVEVAPDTEEQTDADDFGREVADDARGVEEGDEPGVDGCEVAREASGRALEDCGNDTDEDGDEAGEAGTFGEGVSQDATGASDGTPGVNGREVAENAKANGGGDDDLGTSGDDLEGEESGDDLEGEESGDDLEDGDVDDDFDPENAPAGTPGEGRGEGARPGDDS